MRMLAFTVFVCQLLAAAIPATAVAAESPTSAVEVLKPKKQPRPAQPPCAFSPSLNFLDEHRLGVTQEHLASAAWFARAVQLDDTQRALAWKSLSTQPKAIHDLYAGPFGLHATVLEFEKNILVMYRGTQDPLDYVLNAVIYTSPGWIHGLPGWVHTGFLSNFGLTWRRLKNLLGTLAADGRSVVFASHSLGGAMSQFAAWRLENAGLRVSHIYAFQTPNAGDRKFKQKFDERFAGRAQNTLYGDDITPFIPPSRSSVEDFVQATTKPLAGVLALVAKKANYAALDGRLEIRSDGELKEGVETSESSFWQTYREKSGGKGFPLGLSSTSGFVKDHNIDFVLCSLAKF